MAVWPRPCLERPLLRRFDGMAGRRAGRRTRGGARQGGGRALAGGHFLSQ